MNLSHTRRANRKALFAILIAAAFAASFLTHSYSASPATARSNAEQIAVFDEVWQLVAEKYYDPKFNGVDWNAVRARYRPQLESVASDKEFYSFLNRMTGELRDAHTRVRTPQEAAARRKGERTEAGVLIFEVEGKPVIFDVTAGSAAAEAGVKPGMVVRTVDGRPVNEALAAIRGETGASSSTRAAKILSYLKLIGGEPGTSLNLGLTRADGSTLGVSLPRKTASAAPQIITRTLASGAAYIRVTRFRSPASKRVKEALLKFRQAPGLILDLRANTGGDGKEGLRIAGYFFDRKVPIARVLTRTGKPPSAFFGLFQLPPVLEAGEQGAQLYSGPLVVLVNEGTGSTSELIAGAMQEHRRAHIIGTATAGAVLGVLDHHKLRGGGTLAVSELGLVTPSGRRLEGTGVVPDRNVPLTLRDLQSGHDAPLEAAENYLKK
jgi:carboxyl-terminal processing protease